MLDRSGPFRHKRFTVAREKRAMLARIYRPAKTAMQSGTAKTRDWVLEFVPERGKVLDPLMGWTGSADMNGQVQLRFETRDAAIAYAERHGIAYQVFEPKPRRHILRQNGYGDNFATNRRAAWTH
jgi:NADH dehydrogenase